MAKRNGITMIGLDESVLVHGTLSQGVLSGWGGNLNKIGSC